MPSPSREQYHHGELRVALVAAADAIIRDIGIEGFSLREAARRVGVSPGAASHHFGSMTGLLTEVATLAYKELGVRLSRVTLTGVPANDIQALASAYVEYALDHPGRFRLMCRKDLIDRTDDDFNQASIAAMFGFVEAVAAYYSATLVSSDPKGIHPGVLAAIASVHGVAHMTIEDKWTFAVDASSARSDFLQRLLPTILATLWPERAS